MYHCFSEVVLQNHWCDRSAETSFFSCCLSISPHCFYISLFLFILKKDMQTNGKWLNWDFLVLLNVRFLQNRLSHLLKHKVFEICYIIFLWLSNLRSTVNLIVTAYIDGVWFGFFCQHLVPGATQEEIGKQLRDT